MAITKEQIRLLMARRGERWDNTPLYPTRENLAYLGRFFSKEKRLGIAAVAFLFLQGLFEVALIALSHRYLKNGNDLFSFDYRLLFFVLLFLSALYLGVYFIAVKSERTFIIRLINDLRLKWFKLALQQTDEESDLDRKGLVLSKISYHLPLLSTGLTNSLIGTIRWLLLVSILFFLCFIFGAKLLWVLLFAVIASLGIAIGAFFVSKNYVTRETTFYSKIIKLVDFSLSDWNFTKFFYRERAIIQDFNYLVELDSYFRVRRELWLRFGGGIIFVLLVFFSWGIGLFDQQVNSFLATPDLVVKFALAIFIVYFSRLLYESLRIGLYLVPFFLGLSLSIPEHNPKRLDRGARPHFKALEFKSSKVKFFKQDRYHKNLRFNFVAGGRYLIVAAARGGKTYLAKFFSGHGRYGCRAWIIKARERRFFYHDFFDKYASFYFIDPRFTSQRTLLEIALGREKMTISNEDLERVTDRVNAHEELRGIFFEKDDWRLKTHKFLTNAKNILLIQVLYCLEKKPFLITLDNYWLDCQDPEIDALLRLLAQELPDSILVFFAGEKRDLVSYQQVYEI